MLSGIVYLKMMLDMIVFVDDKGKFEVGKILLSEWLIYLVCYKVRLELNVVIYMYVVNFMVVVIYNYLILVIYYMVVVLGMDYIFCIFYYIFGSFELVDGVFKGIRESKFLLMQYYGMLVMDVMLEKMLWLVGEIEMLVDLYIKCGGLYYDVFVLFEVEMIIVFEKFKMYGLKV